MGNLEASQQEFDYNNEPVFYCSRCLSLRIRDAGLPDLLYCDECGSSNIETANIEEWEKMYESKYGLKFLDKDYKKI